MADLSNTNLTDLYILEAASRGTREVETGELAAMAGISASQTVKRGRILQSQGLLTLKDGGAGRIYRFSLGPETTRAEVMAELRTRTVAVHDPTSRSAFLALCLVLDSIAASLSTLSGQLKMLLGDEEESA